MQIQKATNAHFTQFWPTFQQIVQAGETYTYPRNIEKAAAKKIWMDVPSRTYVATEDDNVLASYYIKPNFQGPGAHVCNCGYMVAPEARGRGLATALCNHSQQIAIELGYLAMQFNCVASSNEVAVTLWQKLGFEIVGRLPKAFKHPKLGYVDAFIMYKCLAGDDLIESSAN